MCLFVVLPQRASVGPELDDDGPDMIIDDKVKSRATQAPALRPVAVGNVGSSMAQHERDGHSPVTLEYSDNQGLHVAGESCLIQAPGWQC